jgi:hypothetical protein
MAADGANRLTVQHLQADRDARRSSIHCHASFPKLRCQRIGVASTATRQVQDARIHDAHEKS